MNTIFKPKDVAFIPLSYFKHVQMDLMVRTAHLHVTTNVMDVTTSMVSVIGDVNRAGREITVNNVMYSILTMI